MSRSIALNALFIVAGCTSAAVQTILYRLALIVIVLLLHTLWLRTVMHNKLVRLGSGNASRRTPPIHISHENE